MNAEQIRRRVRAARILGGFDRVDDLAAALDLPGLKRDTLYAIEGGSRVARPQELRVIAAVCDLPYEFFTIDFARLASVEHDSLEQRLRALEDEVRRLAGERAAPAPPGELGRRAEGSQPSAERPREDKRTGEEDQARGGEG